MNKIGRVRYVSFRDGVLYQGAAPVPNDHWARSFPDSQARWDYLLGSRCGARGEWLVIGVRASVAAKDRPNADWTMTVYWTYFTVTLRLAYVGRQNAFRAKRFLSKMLRRRMRRYWTAVPFGAGQQHF